MADFTASPPVPPRRALGAGWRVALAAAAAGLGAGAAVWIGASGPQDANLRVLLMSGAAALGAGAAAGVGWSLDLARRGQNTLEAIYALEEAADAYVLADDLGAALGANRAGRRLFAHVASGPGGRRRLAAMLGADSDAEGRIYRLIRGALETGSAEDSFRVSDGGLFAASVSRLARGKGETLWRIRREEPPAPSPAPEAPAPVLSARVCADLPIGYYRADRGGAVLEANPALLALAGRAPGDPPARLEDLFEEGAAALSPALAAEDEEIRVSARLRGGGLVETTQRLIRDAQGATEAHGFVMRAARASGRVSGATPRLPQYFDAAPLAIAVADSEGLVIESNDRMMRLTQGALSPGASLAAAVKLEDRKEFDAALKALAAGEAVKSFEAHLPDREGPPRIAQIFMDREGGGTGAILAYFIDVSEQRSLELKFAQSQKMQAIGQLVGNLAHDFNNLLTVIIGHCDLLLQNHEAGDPGFADINQVKQTANRGAALVRHLLAFSRQQTLKKRSVRLTEYFSENLHMLHRMSSERIRFTPHHARDLWPVNIDPDAFFTVLMNLVINARDAMPEGGSIFIRSENVSREESARLDNPILPPADYVMIEVRDTGTGIPRENLGKIFEPFFSTKGANGTGLGLASVYGAIKQMDGFIFVESEPGEGAAFRIFLPRHAHEEPAPAAQAVASRDLSGKGLILLVEDEAAVRSFASRALEVRGYQVLQAASGEEALALLADQSQKIDLIISDVVMPNMDGPTLLSRIRESGRDTRILFISGYAEEAFRKNLRSGEEFLFLPKPFSLKDLAVKVKQALT